MPKVHRSENLDFLTYGEQRDRIRAEAMAAKALRRVHLGEHLTFLFENHTTIRYQILEMVRAEQMVKESLIQHELDTYNAVLGDDGELGCTLLIEISDEAERAILLHRWRDLPGHIFMAFTDGTREAASFDAEQMNDEKDTYPREDVAVVLALKMVHRLIEGGIDLKHIKRHIEDEIQRRPKAVEIINATSSKRGL